MGEDVKRRAVLMEDETLRMIAGIDGPLSAAARALEEAERQRANGMDAVVLGHGKTFTVCSRKFAEMRLARTRVSHKEGE